MGATRIDQEKMSTVEAALRYTVLGFSIIPVRGKMPAVAWKPYQVRRASVDEVSRWARRGLFGNVGLVCGAVSGNLVALDFDALDAYAAFCARFPALAASCTVASGGGGRHVYLRTGVLPRSCRGQGVELCAEGRQVVAPPSVHASGKRYRVLHSSPILHVPDLEEVARWIRPDTARSWPGASKSATSVSSSLMDAIAAHFRAHGYRQRGDWLNGPCIYPERHAHGDARVSFGFNCRTGYGWCFTCDRSMTMLEITKRLQ